MSDLPQITMTGGLVDDVELRFTPSGKAVANFRLAGKKRVRDAQGQWTDGDPIYLTVTCWEKLAENVAETLVRKGQRVTVTGRLAQQWWNDQSGERKSKYVIEADTVSVDLQFSSYKEAESGTNRPLVDPASDPWAQPVQVSEPPF